MNIKNNYHKFAVIAIAILLIILSTSIFALSQYTLIAIGKPAVCFALLALLSGILLWKSRLWCWLTNTSSFLPNYLCHTICTGILGLAIFYIGNYAFAQDDTGHMEKTRVEKMYKEVHYKSRRIGRNRYTRGEAYKVYYMKVKFSNGQVKDLQIEPAKYMRLHEGDTISLYVSSGLFGIPVVKYNHVTKYTYGTRYQTKRK